MRVETITLWDKQDYTYPVIGDFSPFLTAYLHEDSELRPAIVVVPGGGYRFVSVNEGELVAKRFYEKGFQTFVLTYTTCMPGPEPVRFQALKDLSKAIVCIRRDKTSFHVKEDRIALCGFSAGAHLCASLAVHYDEPAIQLDRAYAGISNRPDAAILSYPVVTSGKFAHRDSFVALLGENASEEELEYMSIEKHVKPDTPPLFIWQTETDETIPVQNSYLLAASCASAGVPYELHVFHKGIHGLSLSDEEWESGNFDGMYCMRQLTEFLSDCINKGITPVEPFSPLGMLPKGTDVAAVFSQGMKSQNAGKAEPCVKVWPELAINWLTDIWA